MNHIFLTGEIQIGKSTIIKKTLSLLNVKYGGVLTYFGADRANPDRCLYISEASKPLSFSEQHVVAHFQKALPPQVLTHRFNTLGVSYIAQARKNAALIILDECGSLEQEAFMFQDEILKALDGAVPVLGVVKLSSTGWVDKIRYHPNVTLLTVDGNNRDSLPEAVVELFTGFRMRPLH